MNRTITTIAAAAILATATLSLPGQAAEPAPAPAPGPKASTTKDKAISGEPILMGVRASSSPVSYKDGNTYIGLAVDLCTRAIEDMKKSYPKANFKFVEVTSSTRIDMLKEGKIDLECGSTTNSASRRKEVNFSVPYYIASVKAVKLKSNTAVRTLDDIGPDSTVIFTDKTTTADGLGKFNPNFRVKSTQKVFKLMKGKDHQDSFDLLTAGKGDIFANDDILLKGLIERSKDPSKYEFLPENFSLEPYAVMTRKDDEFMTTAVSKTITKLMLSGEFDNYYTSWFLEAIPPFNKSLKIPMSPLLREYVRMPTRIVGN
ncbi:amino acid ABC transporter substrate-binding protein [Diaphorobacter aerolatus]|uniref:Amino acid ABC transporter substrate-binding protein n=1 Tax=Diaphorobacter aerolatus TaxID=1288495 RepID=A0A7H0GJD3_9BURK|nr:amino acid ABC transporter substrate-binding protein [Diaphorobacter aerolatus]QNP48399.1 amino acid ABC transporter substrate-binding protein [Diaphorobacter aerolatus]